MSDYCINFSLYRFTVLVLLSCSFSFAQELDKLQVESDALVYEGNLASKENFIEAEKYYRKAISKKETNAKGFLESLRELGYRAEEIDVHRGLHRIAISGYGSRKEAKRARTKILKDQGISSWILKVK